MDSQSTRIQAWVTSNRSLREINNSNTSKFLSSLQCRPSLSRITNIQGLRTTKDN